MMGDGKGADSCKEATKAHLGFPLMDSVDQGVVQLLREALNLVFSLSVDMPDGFGVKPEQRCHNASITPLLGLCILSRDKILSCHPVQRANRGPGHV